jgi:hypothetical protein
MTRRPSATATAIFRLTLVTTVVSAAVVALVFASAVAAREERALEAEAATLETRLDALDACLDGIEDQLRRRSLTLEDEQDRG